MVTEIPVGIEQGILSNKTLAIYPNPSDDHFMLSNPFHEKNIEIMVYDHSGKLIFESKSDQDFIEIDLGEMTAGLYFISVKSETGILTEKIIIQ